MIAGNTIGAGILGFPILTGLAGFLPALVGLTAVWLIMWGTGYILADRMTIPGRESTGLPTLFSEDVGWHGKGIAMIGYLVNYYGIMVAYLSGATAITIKLLPIAGTIPEFYIVLAFFFIFTGFTLFGENVVRHGNFFLMTLLFVTFFALLIMAFGSVDTERLKFTDWSFFPATIR